jgi:prepilin-type N-terminal cleavage/methylation domain-containing protein
MRIRPRTTRFGFTLIELMVVLLLITSVITLGIPTLRKLTEFSRGSAGVNSISVAVNAARIYNHRLERSDLGDSIASGMGADYSGTAVLFTPAGEIRLVENNQHAATTSSPSSENDYLETTDLNGYKDIDGVDYVTIPASAGVMGVVRTGSNPGDIELLPPPFAICFNQFGQIVVPPTLTQDKDFIYYDSDYNGVYNISNGRGSSYDPTEWNGVDEASDPGEEDLAVYDSTENKRLLPFEKIEVVSAVILYDARELTASKDRYTPSADPDEVKRVFDHGTPLYFSPLTGLVLTSE